MRSKGSFMTRLLCALLFLLGLRGTEGQEVVPRYRLEVSRETPLGNLAAANLLLPHGCDARGNLYIRVYQPSRTFLAPIHKFTPEGERKAVFSTDSVKDWEGAEIYDYAIGSDGQVYLLAVRENKDRDMEFGVLAFAEDGRHRFSIPIKIALDSVEHLGVFSSGEFLLIGFRKVEEPPQRIPGTPSAEENKRKRPPVEPIFVVVNRNGEVLREAASLTNSHAVQTETGGEPIRVPASAVNRATLAAGDDGHIYLLLAEEKPTVYAISRTGEVVRTLKVNPPGEKAVALRIAPAPGLGLLLVTAEKQEMGLGAVYPGDRIYFSLIDPQSGERLYDYQSNTKLGGSLACPTPQGMLFVGESEGKLVIRKATFR
jgi:hypothetical protein